MSTISQNFASPEGEGFPPSQTGTLKIQNERRLGSMGKLLKFLKENRGASSIEYGLLVALIGAVIVGAVTLLGGNLKTTFDYVATIVPKL